MKAYSLAVLAIGIGALIFNVLGIGTTTPPQVLVAGADVPTPFVTGDAVYIEGGPVIPEGQSITLQFRCPLYRNYFLDKEPWKWLEPGEVVIALNDNGDDAMPVTYQGVFYWTNRYYLIGQE